MAVAEEDEVAIVNAATLGLLELVASKFSKFRGTPGHS